jgi:hypothetical protein
MREAAPAVGACRFFACIDPTLPYCGAAQVGTRVLVMPGGLAGTVRALEVRGAPAALARAGDAVEVRGRQWARGANRGKSGEACVADAAGAAAAPWLMHRLWRVTGLAHAASACAAVRQVTC